MTQQNFQSFNILQDILNQIKKINYTEPTPIQIQAIPSVLEGHDVLGQAQTGTGKTAAFCIPIINNIALDPTKKCLILSPTRELAIQTYDFCSLIAVDNIKTVCCYGGSAYTNQISALKKGANVIVGTPGRIIDLIEKDHIKISDLSIMILDEADQMFNMGFLDDIKFILDQLNDDCQRLLFSATFSSEILNISKRYLRDPKIIRVESKSSTAQTISQNYAVVEKNKEDAIDIILDFEEFVDGVIVFENTKKETMDFCNSLRKNGRSVSFINGDISQSQREKVISDFKNKRFNILVATDVAARGLDIDHITHVFQLELPFDVEPYVHRIGRTGRIGRLGKSIVFVSRKNEHVISMFAKKLKCEINQIDLSNSKEIEQKRINSIINKLELIASQKDLTLFKKIVQENDIYSNIDLVAALLYTMQSSKPISFDQNHFLSPRSPSRDRMPSRSGNESSRFRSGSGERRSRGNMYESRSNNRFEDSRENKFISYNIKGGKKTGLSVKELLESLESIKIHRYNIGKIEIGNDNSVVQIKSNVPQFIISSFRKMYRE